MISVVIPVYNTEKYLRRCIDSIIIQTYKDFEAIFVDDGSSDLSGMILDDYQQKDSRIRVFHQENQGVSKARFLGVSQAKGEWVTFVDSDDYLPADALEGYVDLADDTTDIIIGWLDSYKILEKILEIEEYRKRCIAGNIHIGPHTHTFRRSILSPAAFNFPKEIRKGEDMLMNVYLSFQTEKPVKVLRRVVYFYDTSVMTSAIHTIKMTMEGEQLFYSYMQKVIPTSMHEKYHKELLRGRLNTMIRYIKEHPFDTKWRHSDFYRRLSNEIIESQIPISRSHHVLMYSNSLFYRLFVIFYIYLRFDLWKKIK